MTYQARPRTPSSDTESTISTQKSPRIAKFAEATSVNSPLDPVAPTHFNFGHSPQSPAKVSFGATIDHSFIPMEHYGAKSGPTVQEGPISPLMSPPLRSALKTPVTAKTIFSPTFKEEQDLEKAELRTEKEQVKDLKVKTRVRVAKLLLRGVGFSCALIILSMLTTVFTIFRATRNLPPRYYGSTKMTPWAKDQMQWPQITVLSIACFALLVSIIIFYQYSRGGHKRVEKLQIYYSTFAIGAFFFSIIMWIVGATVLQTSKNNNDGQDMWAWACNDNIRSKVFGDDIDYKLACRLQNWSLICCIIEVIVDVLLISVYAIVFYRYWTIRRLRKTMLNRDKARSDLYLAQLRSAPTTPGFALGQQHDPDAKQPAVAVEEQDPTSAHRNNIHVDANTQFATSPAAAAASAASARSASPVSPIHAPKPFVLQPAPTSLRTQGITPQIQQTGFTPISPSSSRLGSASVHSAPLASSPPPPPQSPQSPRRESVRPHVAAAPGEAVYDAVPIPGAYAGAPVSR